MIWNRDSLPQILNDPAKLGEFLEMASEIMAAEKIARKQAINLLLRGTKVPGWLLRRRENAFVLPLSLAPLAKESLFALLETFGSISERRYRSLCALCGVEPEPSAILRAGASVVLARVSKQK